MSDFSPIRELDEASAAWLRDLAQTSPGREAAIVRLRETLLGAARAELRRRADADISGPELDDLAHQSADDSVVAILAKLDGFRGESRFTTWAYSFMVREVSTKLGRHFWRTPRADLDQDQWEQLPNQFGLDPQYRAEWKELVIALRHAMEHDLTHRQRCIFCALVLRDIPLDALVAEHSSSRNAIHKAMFDTRRKLRRILAAKGYSGIDFLDRS
jgi:RNA polymerase sigma-70 factor (ECF subfamily)